ncbi:hypothetical protein [Chengkuizengella axinellae]|uniref:Lipoprotein n=1 Tax=Chengkuizengella axinellae TaxID=3064388 RepID=A0ABT9J154_9BACL|nr:hypothetical protein [Chengkuizengella sp. 2205SS18-9]MDP5275346.1 hypothetical protein [Chengkuizengella sp. 2205SS18-9]
MKYKLTTALSTVLIASVVLSACGTEKQEAVNEEPKEQVEQTEGSQNTDTVENEEVEAEEVSIEDTITYSEVNTYKQIIDELSKEKEGEAADWNLASTLYADGLKETIVGADDSLDVAISAALEAGANRQLDTVVALQVVDKTTQSYFYKKQKNLQSDVVAALEEGNQEVAELAFTELKYLAEEVLVPTAAKRDSYYSVDMQIQIENGLSIQEAALIQGNVDDLKVYKQMTDKTVYRSYYLAANSYAEKIAAAVQEGGAEKVDLQIKQAEAWGFYQAIKGSLSGGDEEAAAALDTIFDLGQTDPETMNADEVADLFVKTFVGKIIGYHGKVPVAIEEGNITDARVEAMEANVFMKAIELETIERLGEEQAADLMEKGEAWFEAVSNENAEEASSISAEIVEALNQLF